MDTSSLSTISQLSTPVNQTNLPINSHFWECFNVCVTRTIRHRNNGKARVFATMLYITLQRVPFCTYPGYTPVTASSKTQLQPHEHPRNLARIQRNSFANSSLAKSEIGCIFAFTFSLYQSGT